MAKVLTHGVDAKGARTEVWLDDEQQVADFHATREYEALALTRAAKPWTDVNQDSRVALIRQHAKTLPTARAALWEKQLQDLGASPAK